MDSRWTCAALLAACVTAQDDMRIAHLGRGDADGFAEVRAAFAERNRGYDVAWHDPFAEVTATTATLAVFVQRAGADVALEIDGSSSDVSVGDIGLVRPGQTAEARGDLSALVFMVPDELDRAIPRIVRPDFDPKITDTPGGCAEETGAYRRILLTWLGRNGPYTWRALNAHRVRIMDSFTHYHPRDGGFDEFYLVQLVQPGARILTSSATEAIEAGTLTPETAATAFRSTPLEQGDLVYLPRGVIHRGVGGVLAQVITVPGFRPGAEIGVDWRLAAINERLGLSDRDALPIHVVAPPADDGVELDLDGGRARVTIDGEPFTEVHASGFPVPILHPLHGPGGEQLVRGYPLVERPHESRDHPHHRGVWFAHGDVEGIDFWHDGADHAGRIEQTAIAGTDEPNVLAAEHVWLAPDGARVLTDRRTLRFGRIGSARTIDFTVTLRASEGRAVRFGDTKEGTFAIRLAPELRLDGPVATGRIRNSEGDRDGVAWGKRARWVDYSGEIDGRTVGVAILDHPSNHGHPTYWHARGYGLCAANPFGAHDFAKLRKGAGDLVLRAGEETTFRYRVVLHEGDALDADVAELWRRFAMP